jgi:hypothetical protein
LKYILEETSNYSLNTSSARHAVRYLNGHTLEEIDANDG